MPAKEPGSATRPDSNHGRGDATRDRLTETVLTYLLEGGTPEGSLRSFAAAAGVSHSLLLYHFGSAAGVLEAVHVACERREREHFARLRVRAGNGPVEVMRATWRHLARPRMWPLYRLGFTLQLRADVSTATQDAERERWAAELEPLVIAAGVPPRHAHDEAMLWIATCRGLLHQLVTGATPRDIDRAAERLFDHYRPDPRQP